MLGKTDMDPSEDKADNTPAVLTAIIDPVYLLPPESNSEGDKVVFMVGEGGQPAKKTMEEIAREAEEEIT
jgi:hypothetical protein